MPQRFDAPVPAAALSPLRLAGLALATGGLLAAGLAAGCAGSGDESAASTAVVRPDEPSPTMLASTGLPVDVAAGLTLREEPWTFASAEGLLLTTPNYRIHTTVEHARVNERLPHFMEAALAHYRTSITPLPGPPRPMETYVFGDRRQWEIKTRQVIPDQAGDLRNLGRGGFSTRGMAVLYYIDWGGRDRDTLAIAGHEGWHQYTQTTFRNALPLWLEEGLATYMEGHRFATSVDEPDFLPHWNPERLDALGWMLRRDRLIPLEDLMSKSPQAFLAEHKYRLLGYYGQVWALTRFLVEHEDGKYRSGLERVLRDASEGRLTRTMAQNPRVIARGGRRDVLTGRNGPWLALTYFTDDLATFESEYVAFCRQLREEWRDRRRRRR